MKLRLLLMFGLLTPVATFGQAVSYSSNLTTTATNVPAGASAPVMTVPNGLITVCSFPGTGGPPCSNTIAIFRDIGLTQPISQPLIADPKGKFQFFTANPGNYAVYVQNSAGTNVGNYPITLGGTGGGSGSPGGINQAVQFNLSSTFGGDAPANFGYNNTTHLLTAANQQVNSAWTLASPTPTIDNALIGTITTKSNAPSTPSGTQTGTSTNSLSINTWNYGQMKNTGNATSSPGDGWRTLKGINTFTNAMSAGIVQNMFSLVKHWGPGDTALGLYSGDATGSTYGGCVDASCEGVVGININGTQFGGYNGGTSVVSTTGLGDIAPVVTNLGFPYGTDMYLIDRSRIVLGGCNLGGSVSSLWESNLLGLGSIAVNCPVTPATGEGITTTALGVGPNLNVAIPQVVTLTVHNGLPLVAGHAWIASKGGISEQTVISCPSSCTPSGGSQTITVLTAQSHPIGSYIFQGAHQGLMSFDTELSIVGINNQTSILTLGASDTCTSSGGACTGGTLSHLIIGIPTHGSINGVGLPRLGVQHQTVTGPITVYQGALVLATDATGNITLLETNPVDWHVGDLLDNPSPTEYVEDLIRLQTTQHTGADPNDGGHGIYILNQTAGANMYHPWFAVDNKENPAWYSELGGWIDPPPTINLTGPAGNFAQFYEPQAGNLSGQMPCGGGTVLCDTNGFARNGLLKLFMDMGGHGYVGFNRANSTIDFGAGPGSAGEYIRQLTPDGAIILGVDASNTADSCITLNNSMTHNGIQGICGGNPFAASNFKFENIAGGLWQWQVAGTDVATMDSVGHFNAASFGQVGIADGCAGWVSGILGSTGSPCGTGGGSGFPFNLGSTSIAGSSTVTAVTGLSVNGVTLNAAGSSSLFLNQAGGYTSPGGASPLTTKGDLFGHSTVDARIPAGTNGQVLTADSTAGLGVSWQTPSGGGAVSSVSNSDGTLTISPTTGAVVASLALGHSNTWTAAQTINSPSSTGDSLTLINTSSSNLAGVDFQSSGGKEWKIFGGGTVSAPGYFGLYDATDAIYGFGFGVGQFNLPALAVSGWVSNTFPTQNPDTGFSRDSAGVVDLGNGTQGNKSGSLNLANLTVTGTCTGCGSSGGTVTHTGALTANALMLGNGSADSKVDTATSDGAGNITATSYTATGGTGLQVSAHVFSALPTCNSGAEGTMVPVTDSSTNTWGATITGGSTNHVLGYCNGSAWTVAAK